MQNSMPFDGVKVDPDNPFDKIVFLENAIIQDGFNIGFSEGEKTAIEEGFLLGINKGKEIGKEIGFYKGLVTTFLLLTEDDLKGKTLKIISKFKKQLDEFSFDPQNESINDNLDEIRSKFKQISSILKINFEQNLILSKLSF
nr:uncharacterized protein LOC101238018 isoform X2 [Hydra vulgaris]XP_047126463.1 uncharacterized protein LOC101238018 isoform X2 [Hydra vulgaris]XP_047126464.1 uncharacterized protein LOC101238018 isoform X2 [Hydra vulgaris]XP_047126465.1 uncharacterized protein LOC101238018 isoform X2 [Hydra vulgaris]